MFFSVFISNIKRFGCFYFKTKILGYGFKDNKSTKLSKVIEKGKRISIYGFGPYGEELFVRLFSNNLIINIYDRDSYFMDEYVRSPQVINKDEFDYIVITVMNPNVRKALITFLSEKISSNKIVYLEYS
ncbi:hypothetical protein SAMN02910357_02431 [Succinivibrio dextrinosolvens]|uniref:hypothetical protein n=1 Tax=Succinivibrio dextrinosolvens TaxID=83771 RepID=UPI0008E1C3F8|nr:hypothetical protein [Succinivibrio dextrinosolvens]SFS89217.1 hypothetical protein SAMN02910357_02431 [Succinivibrio dextrinosolvens]